MDPHNEQAPQELEEAPSKPETMEERLDFNVETEVSNLFDELAEVEEPEIRADDELTPDEGAALESEGWDEPPPERWPEEIKTVYKDLPMAARKAMLDGIYKPMQRAYGQTTQELAQMRKQVEPMLESMNNYRNDFERMGVDPAHAFRTQMAWAAHIARVGPKQGLKDMSAAYGQNVGTQGQEKEQYLTPVEREMKTKIEQLSQQVAGTYQTQQLATEQERRRAYVNQYTGVQNELQAFTSEQKDGKPAHPHIEKVAPAIAGLIRGGLIRATNDYGQPIPIRDQMAQAYQMACNLDPSIRNATGTATRQTGRAIAAQRVGVVANNPAGDVDVPRLSIADQLDETYDKIKRRA